MEVGAYAAVQSVPDIGREKPTRSNHARLLESCMPASQEIIYRLTTENRILKYR